MTLNDLSASPQAIWITQNYNSPQIKRLNSLIPSHWRVYFEPEDKIRDFFKKGIFPTLVFWDQEDAPLTDDLLNWISQYFPETLIVLVGDPDREFLLRLGRLGVNLSVIPNALSKEELSHFWNHVEQWHLKIMQKVYRWEELKKEKAFWAEKKRVEEKELSCHLDPLERQKSQITEVLLKKKKTNQFIKELIHCSGLEETLKFLRKVTKKIHKLQPPILGFKSSSLFFRFFYFQGDELLSKSISLRDVKELQDERQFLANVFSRPIGRLLKIPLTQYQADEKRELVLYFEHDLRDEDQRELLTFLEDKLQPLSMALSRFLVEEDLKRAALYWEKTFSEFSDPICILNENYEVLRHNKAFSSAKSLSDCHCYHLFVGQSSPCSGCPVEKVLFERSGQMGEVKRGVETYVVHSFPIKFKKDMVVTALVNYYKDVTATQKLRGQVIQSEKMAAVGYLAGNIAHELNNPLTGIRSVAQLWLSDPSLSDSVKGDLKEIEEAAKRCQAIIKNLLEYSEQGLQDKKQIVCFNDLVKKTLPLLKTALRDYHCHFKESKEAAWVQVEPQLMQQVIFNLINNACQAMEEGKSIEMAVDPVVQEGQSWWQFQVKDTGRGIPLAIQDKVFDAFFTTKKEGQGTGLGLNLAKNIVEGFGGRIFFKSQEGKGTTFYVWLPQVKREKK